MFPEFSFDPPAEAARAETMSPEEERQYQELLSRLLKPEERDRVTHLLLERLKERKPQMEHNKEWERHTRPMLEAFTHAKFMVEMAVRYADLPEPPVTMPSGWAALLYLYDLR